MTDVSDYSHLPDFRSDERKELDRLHSEIARLRRENEALVEAMKEVVAEGCNCSQCTVLKAALRSAAETKGG
jgi:hypothetical protein